MRRWPDWMPVPQKDDYAVQTEDRRTKPEFGVFGELIDEFGMEEGTIECTLLLDQVQTAWLESLEQELLWQGAEWFEMPLLSGREITWHKVRMRERPNLNKLTGCLYTWAALKLEVDDGPDEAPGPDDIPAWPDDFPLPLQDNYSYAPYDRRASAQMEVGNLRRVEYRTDETHFQCAVIMTREEVERLRRWVRRDLKRGTRWFLMPLQSAGHIDMHTARLKAMPKIAPFAGLHMQVTLDLDVWRRENPMCSWITELFICRPPEDFTAFHKTFDEILGNINILVPDFWVPGACQTRKVLYEFGN